MSKEEIKSEINKVLDHLSDKTLQDVLSFLKKIEDKAGLSIVDQSVLTKSFLKTKAFLRN